MEERVLAKQAIDAIYQKDLWSCAKVMEQGVNPNWLVNGYPYLIHAIEVNDYALVELLIQYGSMYINQGLYYALKRGRFSLAYRLFKLGAIPLPFNPSYKLAKARL